ncbi:MAG: terpene cyclase/mutase family protein [Planctomycetes bacterium]|nr:terpene cyclase/mutase family protein [Planctomycetota bacterium]
MAQDFPELVFQKHHGPGLEPARTFEDALRDLVKNSPYLGISLLLHGIVFAVLFLSKTPPVTEDPNKKIIATPEQIEEVLPPEPEPPPPEVEDIDEIVDDPVITEDVTNEVTEVVDSPNIDAAFDSTNSNDVIGVGGGAGGNFSGKVGKRGQAGTKAGHAELQAVDDALRWLKFHQDPEGYWSASSFDEQCGQLGQDTICDGRGSPLFDTGVTGLSLLAFLGAGNTDKAGRYKDTVNAGLKYLVKNQSRDGNFADPNHNEHTYDHIIATLAVTEAYAITKRQVYKRSVENALDYMYSLRNPGAAWRYADKSSDEMITHPNDTSVTGWAILVLTLARDYGIKIDQNALEDAMVFIEKDVTDPTTGRTGYFERGGGPSRPPGADEIWRGDLTESMTAVAVLCRIFVDPNLERAGNKDMIKKGVDLMLATPIKWSEDEPGYVDFYYWYYATYAMYQWGSENKADWNKWNEGIHFVIDHQNKEGEKKGSWDPQVDPWSRYGGRVYSTAILALLLEVYYRYDTVIGAH